jgi:hypothetical protein
LNQSATIKLKNKKFKLEKDAVKKAANQKQHDVIFDVLKK